MTLPVSHERLYRIQNDTYHYYCGTLSDGRQIIMGVQRPRLTLVEFDSDGNFVGVSFREIASPVGHTSDVVAKPDQDQLEVELQNWQYEIGITPGTVAVKQFFLSDFWIGIAALPDHYQDVLDNPDNYDEARRQMLEEDIRCWRLESNFVFYWNEDYYLDAEGALESS